MLRLQCATASRALRCSHAPLTKTAHELPKHANLSIASPLLIRTVWS
jgi:hypothetical protein